VSDVPAAARPTALRYVKLVLFYLVVGPPLGGAIFLPFAFLIGLQGGDVLAPIRAVLAVVAVSYLLGGVPALVCGAVAASALSRGRVLSAGEMAGIGAGAALLFLLLLGGLNASGAMVTGVFVTATIFALIAAGSAALCRRMAPRLHEAAA
jgi:hypothetical protein